MTFVIAEAGVNHNGSVEQAIRLIDAAAVAGADAVKFQTFKAEKLVSKNAQKADYQKNTTTADESQLSMLRRLELSEEDHYTLHAHCAERNIQFLSTPFDIGSMEFLHRKLNVPIMKVSSGDITNAPLLLAIARTQRPVILSTGMSLLGDIEMALSILAYGYTESPEQRPTKNAFVEAYSSDTGKEALMKKVSLLHCTTEYPTPFSDVNLRVMDALQSAFGLPVGLSDHTQGIIVPIAAVARGADIIEKHFTLSRDLPGPDHKASLEPEELAEMVRSIRIVERSLGSSSKRIVESEKRNVVVARKGLVATKPIKRGEVFTELNLGVKRPATGVSPIHYWDFVGKRAPRDFEIDEPIDGWLW